MLDGSVSSGGGINAQLSSSGVLHNALSRTLQTIQTFLSHRVSVMQQIHGSIAAAQQRPAAQANQHGRSNFATFTVADRILLHKSAITAHAFRTRAAGMFIQCQATQCLAACVCAAVDITACPEVATAQAPEEYLKQALPRVRAA
ncbi:hypothetical protein DYB36_011596 [Aphanomyces astaci]|uniref:Uncharacterized protein n=1 Tax=Aphanomyces astaci TaxID=112090 RepID=A0A396ZW84_APHAT|nr:hypothetical protein DYB36_011596 [Aphanomyces astaci]